MSAMTQSLISGDQELQIAFPGKGSLETEIHIPKVD